MTTLTHAHAGRLLLLALALAPRARAQEPPVPYDPAPSLALVERRVEQGRVSFEQARDHQKCWVFWEVTYLLRNEGVTPIELSLGSISAEVDGAVSNARVPCHAVPRKVAHAFSPSGGPTGLALGSTVQLVESADDARSCREAATLELTPGPPPGDEMADASHGPMAPEADDLAAPADRLVPGQTLVARLRLEHQHFLYGPFDPLLGDREFTLRVGPATFRDDLPLDRPLAEVFPPCTWENPPADRLDPRYFVSSPDSLRLSASVPGQHGFDFPERPIRYATPMRLSFWYLIAPGVEGRCLAEIKQYRDAPRSYRALPEAKVTEDLCQVGRWVQVQRVFRTDPQATTLRLRFTVDSDTNLGDLWIDDVHLEPLASRPPGP
jgi:hypothetical protein